MPDDREYYFNVQPEPDEVRTELKNLSAVHHLHGFFFTGEGYHGGIYTFPYTIVKGNPQDIKAAAPNIVPIFKGEDLALSYADIKADLSYLLGFAILNCCYGGLSSTDKEFPARYTTGGRDIVSQSPSAAFYSSKGNLVPIIETGRVAELFGKGGAQGTRKLK
jgi:hypothetical protein